MSEKPILPYCLQCTNPFPMTADIFYGQTQTFDCMLKVCFYDEVFSIKAKNNLHLYTKLTLNF